MGIRIVEGRALNVDERPDRPREVLVNRTFVRQYLPTDPAIGSRLSVDGPAPWEIVGVVDDVRHAGLTAEPLPELYIDYRQAAAVMPASLGQAFFTVRTTGDPVSLVAAIRSSVRQLDPQLAVDNIATMEQRLAGSIARPRFYAALTGALAVIAIVLSAVGIYGVMAYAVSQCTRDIGVRIALGASTSDVLVMVMRQGCLIAGCGMAMGLIGAAAVTRSLDTLLFGLTPFDPATFALVSLLVGLVALVACYVPARRAMRIDPIVALRQE
jgi:putative ABC transport system permease protein